MNNLFLLLLGQHPICLPQFVEGFPGIAVHGSASRPPRLRTVSSSHSDRAPRCFVTCTQLTIAVAHPSLLLCWCDTLVRKTHHNHADHRNADKPPTPSRSPLFVVVGCIALDIYALHVRLEKDTTERADGLRDFGLLPNGVSPSVETVWIGAPPAVQNGVSPWERLWIGAPPAVHTAGAWTGTRASTRAAVCGPFVFLAERAVVNRGTDRRHREHRLG